LEVWGKKYIDEPEEGLDLKKNHTWEKRPMINLKRFEKVKFCESSL